MTRRVTVVGSGVVGLSIAYELSRQGDEVTVVADKRTMETVSAVSAALWFPYRSERSELADQLLTSSLARFTELARDPETGVHLRRGTVIERTIGADRSWTAMLSSYDLATMSELPDGAVAGIRAELPFVEIPTYLPWLEKQVMRRGARFETRTVDSVRDLGNECDVVVIAAGLRGGLLLGDDQTVYPVRGQIVRLTNPGLTEWVTDNENPDGLTYVFPRDRDVIVGGTAQDGAWDTSIDEDESRQMIERACRLVPVLRGQNVLAHACGLRPARSAIRLERIVVGALPVVAAYGHGGAGVTLSWGTAEEATKLANV